MSSAFGFPKSIRLRKKTEIDPVFRQGQYHRFGWLQAKTQSNAQGTCRFMVSVSRRVGPAPARNRIKRVVREAIRLNRHRLSGSHDICLFVTTRPRDTVRLADVERDLRRLFGRLALPHDARIPHG